MKRLNRYLDSYGLLTEIDGEGGDTACEHFAMLVMLRWLGEPSSPDHYPLDVAYSNARYELMHDRYGLIRRHPHAFYWGSDWNRGTGDQMQNAVIASFVFVDRHHSNQWLAGFKERWWFTHNTMKRNIWMNAQHHEGHSPSYKVHDPRPEVPDFRPLFKALFIRGHKMKWLRPLLYFYDTIDLLVGAIRIRLKLSDKCTINYFMKVNFAKRNWPTLISRFAYWLTKDKMRLEHHFRTPNPPLHLLTSRLERQ